MPVLFFLRKIASFIFLVMFIFSSLSFPQIISAEPTTAGLVRYWKLDETVSGGVGSVLDHSPTGDHATPVGSIGSNNTPQPSVDVPNVSFVNERSRNFDGTDDRIETQYSPSFAPGDSFSWSLWFKTPQNQAGVGLFSARDSSKPGQPLAEIYLASGQIQGLFRGANGVRRDLLYSTTYSDNEWRHVSVVINDGEGLMYVDGVHRASFSDLDMNINLSDVFFTIGAANYENNIQRFYTGLIDDIRVYNRALSPGEVSELAGVFPISENFNDAQPEKWELRSNATWGATVDGEQALRLTTATTSQSGLGYYDTAFSSDQGIVAEFDYYSNEGTGADGIVFFLVDGDLVNVDNIAAGAFGSSLGYALSGTTPGVPHAYLGVGFDEFGGFPRSGGGKTGIATAAPDNVTLRGAGNGTSGYDYLTHTQVSQPPINQSIDGGWRKVRVGINPTIDSSIIRVEMSWDEGDTWYTVIDDYEYMEAPPEFFKLGFTAGTGGSTNVHAIDNLKVSIPADLELVVNTQPVDVYDIGNVVEYSYTVTNNGPNDAGLVTIQNTISSGLDGFVDIDYTYSSTSGATGAGDETTIDSFSVFMEFEDILTVTVTATVGPEVDLQAGLDHIVSAVPGEGIIDPSPGNANRLIVVETGDTQAPFIENFNPQNGAVDVEPTQNLTIRFNEPVTKGHGHLVFYKASDDKFILNTVDITSSAVSGSGTDTIIINPGVSLPPLTELYVHIPATGFRDLSNNTFPGFEDSETWRFTTSASPETPKITATPSTFNLDENGGTQEIIFTLSDPIITPEALPTGLVLYPVSSDINIVTVNSTNLHWSNEQWNEPRSIVVTTVDNDDVGNASAYVHWYVFTYAEFYQNLSGSIFVNIIDDERVPREGVPTNSSRSAPATLIAKGCRDNNALNYSAFVQHEQSLCLYTHENNSNEPHQQKSNVTELNQEIITINQKTVWCNNLGIRSRLIRQNDRGGDVLRVQECLNIHGEDLILDGIFGSQTLEALKNFQKNQNITIDGIVGSQTWATLKGVKQN